MGCDSGVYCVCCLSTVAAYVGKKKWLFLLYESFFFLAFFVGAFLALRFRNYQKR